MKTFVFILIGLISTAQSMVDDKPVSKGEVLNYKISLGWITVGRADFQVSDGYVTQDDANYLRVEVKGKSTGLAGILKKFNNRYGALIDEQTMLPRHSYRKTSEGNKKTNEDVYYDYESMNIHYDVTRSKQQAQPTRTFEMEEQNTFDLMGGLMYARSLDYRNMEKGDTIVMDAFYDKKFYNFKMTYQGIEMIDSKVGDINCYKVVPVMEKNSLFEGKDAVAFWLSADRNRLPLKISAKVKMGTAKVELVSYKNVKSGIDFD